MQCKVRGREAIVLRSMQNWNVCGTASGDVNLAGVCGELA